jgi:hypothetical protein
MFLTGNESWVLSVDWAVDIKEHNTIPQRAEKIYFFIIKFLQYLLKQNVNLK